jgi:hypothetical protein
MFKATWLDYKQYNNAIAPVLNVSDIIESIRNGTYRPTIDWLRGVKDTNPDRYRKIKLWELPAFFPGMIYQETIPEGRHSNCLMENFQFNEGLSTLDFDDVTDMETIWQWGVNHPACVFAFKSPSGKGVKICLSHQSTDNYTELRMIKANIPMPDHIKEALDPACVANASLKCFVSHDDSAYYNANPEPMTVTIPDEQIKAINRAYNNPIHIDMSTVQSFLTSVAEYIRILNHDDYMTAGMVLSKYGRADIWHYILSTTDWSKYAGRTLKAYDENSAKRDYDMFFNMNMYRVQRDLPCRGVRSLTRLIHGYKPTTYEKMLFGIADYNTNSESGTEANTGS